MVSSVSRDLRTASAQDSSAGSPLVEISADGHVHTLRPDLFPKRSLASYIRAFWWNHPRLRESWSELRSCYQHIWLLCKQGPTLPLEMGTEYLTGIDGHLVLNTTTQARIRDIQTESQQYRCLSPFVVREYMRGWNRGREHGVRTFGRLGEEPLTDNRPTQHSPMPRPSSTPQTSSGQR